MSDDTFWVQLADLVEHEMKRIASGLPMGGRTVSADDLADIGAPMLWCAALVAVSARADRKQFLHICGSLYDRAQIAYATRRPMRDLLNPDQQRGQA